ncbi:MAG: hypothetical protein GY821_07080 [Gammaproteobacteria bacterium]|nr:hypothetical protein [Gammaproteobacteria bacterium]
MYDNRALFFEGFSRIASKGKYIPKTIIFLTQNYLGTIIFFLSGDQAVTIVSPHLRCSWSYNPDWAAEPAQQWMEDYAIQGMTANIQYGIGSAGDAYKLCEYNKKDSIWRKDAQFFWEGDVRWIKKNRDVSKDKQLNYVVGLNKDSQNRVIALKIEPDQTFYIESTIYSPDQVILDGTTLWMLEDGRISRSLYPYDHVSFLTFNLSGEDIIGFSKNQQQSGILAVTQKAILKISTQNFEIISLPLNIGLWTDNTTPLPVTTI